MQEVMARQFDAILVRMGLLLKKGRDKSFEESKRAKVFYLLYLKSMGSRSGNTGRSRRIVGVSERTVRRIREIVDLQWPQLVEEGRRAIRRLRAELLEGMTWMSLTMAGRMALVTHSNDGGPTRR